MDESVITNLRRVPTTAATQLPMGAAPALQSQAPPQHVKSFAASSSSCSPPASVPLCQASVAVAWQPDVPVAMHSRSSTVLAIRRCIMPRAQMGWVTNPVVQISVTAALFGRFTVKREGRKKNHNVSFTFSGAAYGLGSIHYKKRRTRFQTDTRVHDSTIRFSHQRS